MAEARVDFHRPPLHHGIAFPDLGLALLLVELVDQVKVSLEHFLAALAISLD